MQHSIESGRDKSEREEKKKTLFNLCFDSKANGRVQKDHKEVNSTARSM